MGEADAAEALGAHHRRDVAAGPEAQVGRAGGLPRGHDIVATGELGHELADAAELESIVVVLRGDLDHAREQVHDGLVAAVVAIGQLLDGGARGLRDHLVTQADAEDGHLADELGGRLGGLGQLARVAGAVGEEDALGVHGQDLVGRGVPGHHAHVEAHTNEAAQDAALLAAVEGDHLVRAARVVEVDLGRDLVGLRAGDLGHPVGLGDGGGGLHARHEARRVEVLGGDGAAHRARLAHAQGELAGVDALDGHDAVLDEEVGQGALASPVVGRVAHVAHHDAGEVDAVGLHVGRAHAVVADLRVGEGDHLAGVGRVGDDLLVAGHGRVEDELAERLAGRARREPLVRGAVLERQERPRGTGCQQWVHTYPFLFAAPWGHGAGRGLGGRTTGRPGAPAKKKRQPMTAAPTRQARLFVACPAAQRNPDLSNAEAGHVPCRYPVPA